MNYIPYIICLSISLLLSTVLPIAALIWWDRRYKGAWKPAIVGAVIFIVFAMVLEQILHSLVLTLPIMTVSIPLYTLYGGLAAGVFEETGRLVAFRFLLRKREGKDKAIAYGLGHGGIEAILIAGISLGVNLIYLIVLSSQGQSGLAAMLGPEMAQTTATAIAATAPPMLLVSGVERVMAMSLHVALSVLVCLAVWRGRYGWYALAIALHAAVDCWAVLYSAGVITNVLVIEGGVLVMTALICLLAARLYRQEWGQAKGLPAAAEPIPAEAEAAPAPTEE